MSNLMSENDYLESVYLDLNTYNLATNGGEHMFAYCTSLTSLTMTGKPSTKTGIYTDMFYNVTTTGTFYYNSVYDYSRIIEQLPSTWTAEPITV